MADTDAFPNAIGVQECSVQNGLARYPRRDDDTRRCPPIAKYRNNLTALSQGHNLLFVASQDKVHVFEPEYPNQSLIQGPILVIVPPRTAVRRRGYINPSHPHAINHLIVGDLGNDEILLLACDDGDVIAFRVRSIFQAVQRDLDESAYFGPGLDAFFVENVGLSAWGLAVHKEARLIAVSANTHEITIFAFALRNGSSSDSDPDTDDDAAFIRALQRNSKWNVVEKPYDPEQRFSRNLIVHLTGHYTNIPSIAFCNSETDPDGRFLASTDIAGRTYVWDVWRQTSVEDFVSPESDRIDQHFDDGAGPRGWGIACLDPQCFRSTENRFTTFGCSMPRPSMRHSATFWDNTACIRNVSDASRFHPGMIELGCVPGVRQHLSSQRDDSLDSQQLELVDEPDSDTDTNASDEDTDEGHSGSVEGHRAPPEVDQPLGVGPMDQGPDTSEVSRWEASANLTGSNEPSGGTNVEEQTFGDTAYNLRDDQHLDAPDRIQGEDPSSLEQPPTTSREPHLPFRLLHTSEFDITLFHRKHISGCVTCVNVLHQIVPPRLYSLVNFDRMNMIHQIPSLGIVAIASQVGRVALLTMTKLSMHSEGKPSLLGFRVEHILPFQSQEFENKRPEVPLLGMAVGPVQGHGLGDENICVRDTNTAGDDRERGDRRYRLLMIYYDHTVLSYEIGRRKEESGYEVNNRVLHI